MNTPHRTNTRSAIVVGGGLAGIACAVALQSAGIRVTLLEARHALGGRASSFTDPQTGEELDNCQHVLLGCCTNLLDLYRRLGVADKIRWHRTVYFMDERGRRYSLWGVPGLPAPLHMGLSMAAFGLLTLAERFQVARAMLAMLRLGHTGRDALEATSFGDWLIAHGQSSALVEKFYDPVLVSALNEASTRASAKYAIQVFQDAMLAHKRGYLVGLPACPLSQLYAKIPVADVRLNTRVDSLDWDPADASRLRGVNIRTGGGVESISADAVVLATNHHSAQRWLADPIHPHDDSRFAHLDQLESVPILGVHLWFDRPIMPEPALALVKGPLQWLFRKDAEGKVLHGVISDARAWPAIPREAALAQFTAQIQSLFPAARAATLTRGIVVIEKRATFPPLPHTDALRPPQAPPADGTGISNLYLAGDYTQTGWPATMEGAVRAGYLAAQALTGQTFIVPDLPIQWPARLLGL